MLQQNFIRLIYLFVVILERENPPYRRINIVFLKTGVILYMEDELRQCHSVS